MSSVKSVVVLVLILAIIESAFLYVVVTRTMNYHDGYTEVTIEANSYFSWTFNGSRWELWYGSFPYPVLPGSPDFNMALTSSNSSEIQHWYSRKGDIYHMSGLEVKVIDLQSDHVVILVKPTS